MWCHFIFSNGSNPYITMNNSKLFYMLKKYDYEQIRETTFLINSGSDILTIKPKNSYQVNKDILRNIAIDWQNNFYKFNYSYDELAGWTAFFTELGARYGLLNEFKDNGII